MLPAIHFYTTRYREIVFTLKTYSNHMLLPVVVEF